MSILAKASPINFILTADRARALPFYAGALELPILGEDDLAVTLGLADGATVRLTELPGHKALSHTVLGWRTPDIREAVAKLKTRGVTFQIFQGAEQDELAVWTSPCRTFRVAWFADPDGNLLSLNELNES